MKSLSTILLKIILLLALSLLLPGHPFARDVEYVPGEVLVKFKKGTPAGNRANLHSRLNAKKKKEFSRLRLHHLKLPKHMSVEEAIRKYEQDPDVEYAEPNYILYANATTPNDPLYGALWGLNNNNDFDIDAPEAWDIETGSDSIIIAVVDSGLAYNHPDFADNVWQNDIELANGEDGVDNDGNGYVDDFYGYDFVDNDGYPLDLNQHGTHVSGTIAAQGNDSQGITGVMWDAKIMAVRFLGLKGSGSTSDAIASINYACANNARVINNSWGGGGYSTALKNAIEGCASGALFIFAAGNSGSDIDISPHYPASYDSANILSVAATRNTDSLAGFSNYGDEDVDLAAPGVNIYSTIPQYSYGTPVTIYPPAGASEDFEGTTGDPIQFDWMTTGTNNTWEVTAGTGVGNSNSLEDSPGVDYSNYTNYGHYTTAVAYYNTQVDSSVKGQRFLLTFDWMGGLEYNYDWLDMIYSNNGSNWDWIDYRTGTQSFFTTYSADYTAVAETFDSFYFGFAIVSDPFIVGDGVYIDNVEMTKQAISISSYSYVNYNGTSLAAPHVAGVAGLLLTYDPTLTFMELKNAILDNVDTVPNLSAKVATNGRLNAYKALLSVSRPDTPANLSASAISDSRIDLSWNDNAANETGFAIERKTGVGGTYSQIATTGQNITSYSDTGLSASTNYYYRVRAYNPNGNSPYSSEANDTTLAVPADAPSALSATTVSSSWINLSWTDNASAEDGFRIERKDGTGGTWSLLDTVGVDVAIYADTSCSPFTTYFYRVMAYNTGGDSAYSNEAMGITLADPSVTPSNLSTTAVSNSQINLSWTDNSADEDGFKLERKTGTEGTYAQIVTVGQGITSYTNLGLSSSTTYYFRVRAYISSVDTDYSNQANATTFTPPPPAPDPPSGLSAAAVSTSQVNLSWTDKASNEVGFRVERKTGSAGTYAEINTVGANTTSYADTGRTPATTYYYRVMAYNSGGNSVYSNEANATTSAVTTTTTTTTTTSTTVPAAPATTTTTSTTTTTTTTSTTVPAAPATTTTTSTTTTTTIPAATTTTTSTTTTTTTIPAAAGGGGGGGGGGCFIITVLQ